MEFAGAPKEVGDILRADGSKDLNRAVDVSLRFFARRGGLRKATHAYFRRVEKGPR